MTSVQELLNGQVDGLVLFAGAQTPLVERLIEWRLPVISIVHEV
jgi:DNA-binding LacI/PurR family transcriptional regulator